LLKIALAKNPFNNKDLLGMLHIEAVVFVDLSPSCRVLPRHKILVCWEVDVDVDNQYLAMSEVRTLTTPVPRDATC
jgi:hypothetical protein